MRKTSRTIIAVTILSLLTLTGCSILIQPALVPNKHVDQWCVIDPNDYDIQTTKQENGAISYYWNIKVDFDDQKQSIPYWRWQSWLLNSATVRGQLNGRTYPVIFDTGNNLGVLIEDIQINRHDLQVFFFNSENKHDSGGLAIVKSLKVGPLEFENYPCSFLNCHAEHRLLGLVPIHRFQWIVMPTDIISCFSYLEYNQIDKELYISPEQPFTPDAVSEWISYPFEINKKRLLLKIAIEGYQAILFLDTGADYALELNQTIVERLCEKCPDFQKARQHKTYLYTPYAGGKTKAKKLTIKNLQFADSCLRKIEIIYKTESSPKTPFPHGDTDGTIGLGLFKKTIMVLDFKNNLMWVKKAKGSRFEQ